jgi:hypothetical protein
VTHRLRRAAALVTSTVLVAAAAAAGTVATSSAASGATRAAAVAPTHDVVIGGTGVGTYPDFDDAISRYGITTTAETAGTVTVTATTTDPAGRVFVDGKPVTGTTAVTGLTEGDEIAVFIVDSAGTARHSFVYLPVDFPALSSVPLSPPAGAGSPAPGHIMLTLGLWTSPSPFFETAVDRQGVPAFVRSTSRSMDLKAVGNGHYTVFRNATGEGRTGSDLVELDAQFNEVSRHRTVGLADTDGHDALLMPDGSRYLMAYEPDGAGRVDSIVQHISAAGDVLFEWNTADHIDIDAENVVAGTQFEADYAHVNSFQVMADGDLLMSFRHLSSVFKVARTAHDGFAVGDIVWRLGGRASDFSFTNIAGDPDDGPCAQHTATELPNGHILMFDNGAWNLAPLCVDQDNPSGPTISRVPTRISEWQLDEANGTATEVWSYADPTRYAIFAGSAQRLPDGNTVIGWASEPDSIASEVGPDGDLLWDLQRTSDAVYFTYRAQLAAVPDATKPTISVGASTDGATYRQDDVAYASFSCRDRGGSSLRTCSGTTANGARLDTRDIGVHTVTITATDGAGLVTTRKATYRVVSGAYLPDVSARAASGSVWRGVDQHGTAGQQLNLPIKPRKRAQVAVVRITNDGRRADGMRITGSGSRNGFAVTYRYDGRDVTKAVRAGTFRVPTMAPGSSVSLKVRVVRTASVGNGDQRRFTVTARSKARSSIRDSLVIRAVARR